MLYPSRSIQAVLLISSLTLMTADFAMAAGKKKPTPQPGPVYSTPDPVRHVTVRPVDTMPFHLPNGKVVDLQADLGRMIDTAIARKSKNLRKVDQGWHGEDPCGRHLELRAGVSTFQMNIAEFGLKVGYSPTGENSTISDLKGEAKVSGGLITMDFSLHNCVAAKCEQIAAVRASHVTAKVSLSMTINFGEVETGPELVVNTPLEGILSKIMDDGIEKLSKHPALAALYWSAKVKKVVPEAGLVFFDAGRNLGVKPNQVFEIYAIEPAQGVCDVWQTIAYVHTTEQVDGLSSVALIDAVIDDGRGVKEGDEVRIRQRTEE